MTNLDLTNDQLWTVLWALRDRYVADEELRKLCVPNGCMAVVVEERIAEIEGIVANFPELMRQAWDLHRAGVA